VPTTGQKIPINIQYGWQPELLNEQLKKKSNFLLMCVFYLTEILCHFLCHSVFLLVRSGKLLQYLKSGKHRTLNGINQTKISFFKNTIIRSLLETERT